ncbi:molecular chaperone TorD family protein [Marinobacter sp. VGCF2001]|uniref:molecular chaperone TorD family protein n=1 Tax=Marinobacter sp. VGCF2001 TaxID=3417189 RepID=UPI003CF95E5C
MTEPTEAARARGALFRMVAALLDYPLPETRQVLADGRALDAIADTLHQLGMQTPCPELPKADQRLTSLQIGYTNTFLSGRRGKPRVPLVASAYKQLVAGATTGAFLLNIQAFYKHFGLKAAEADEGHVEEPDHLVTMLEFCTLLCHREERAFDKQLDPTPYQRAQRDFLARYLVPLSQAIQERYQAGDAELDVVLGWLVHHLPDWCRVQQQQLEQAISVSETSGDRLIPTTTITQGLWD